MNPYNLFEKDPRLAMRSVSDYSEKHERLFGELKEIEPELANLYACTFLLCHQYRKDSSTARIHLSLTSHAVRELTNALPDVIANNAPGSNHRAESSAKEHLLHVVEAVSADEMDESQREALFDAALSFVQEAQKSTTIKKERAAAVLLGSPHLVDSAITPWIKATDFFMGFVHIDRDFTKALPSEGEVKTNFRRLENSLSASLNIFYQSKADVIDLLSKVNDKKNGTFSIPTKTEIDEALAYLTEKHLKAIFYSNLENPNWVKPLAKAKALAIQPADRETGSFPVWPQGEYLKKMADLTPNIVGIVIAKESSTDNIVARNTIIDIALKLPTSNSIEAARNIAKWADEENAIDHWYWDNEGLISLIIGLGQGDARQKRCSNALTDALFFPRARKFPYGDVEACMPSFHYESHLRNIIKNRDYPSTFGLLRKYIKRYISLALEDSPFLDSSFIIRNLHDDSSPQESNIGKSLCRMMIDAMRCTVHESPERIRNSLFSESEPIIQRCALRAIAIEAERFPEGDTPDSVVQLANEALSSELLFEDELRPEFHGLARVCSRKPDTFSLKPYITRVLEGYEEIKNHSKSNLAARGYSGSELEAKAYNYAKYWQHRKLLVLDSCCLDCNARKRLEELNAEFGKREYDDRRVSITTWDGLKAHLDADELQAMSSQEVIEFLRRWEPSPTEENRLGQAEVLEALVVQNPSFFVKMENELSRLQPCYCDAVLSGWRTLLGQGKEFPVESVSKTCVEVCLCDCGDVPEELGDVPEELGDAPEELGDAPEELGEWDPFYGETSRYDLRAKALSLLVDLVKEGFIDGSMLEQQRTAQAFIEATHVTEKCRAYEAKATEQGPACDYLTSVMTCCQGFEGALRCLSLVRASESRTALASSIASALAAAHSSPAMAFQAGKLIGAIVENNLENLIEFQSLFCNPDALLTCSNRQIALAAAMAAWPPRKTLLDILRPEIVATLEHKGAEFKTGFSIDETDYMDLIGRWVDGGYVFGFLDEDDSLIELWAQSADDAHLARSLENTCHAFESIGTPSETTVQRMTRLWNRRAEIAKAGRPASLEGVAWLAKSEAIPFDVRAQMISDAFATNPQPRDLIFIDDELILLANQNPEKAVAVLHNAAKAAAVGCQDEGWIFGETAVEVLGTARKQGSPQLDYAVDLCMDTLSRVGLIDLDEQICEFVNETAEENAAMR